MFLFTIKITIFFIVLIFLIHHLFNFFKDTLTLPKHKDLVVSANKNMNKILDTLNNNTSISTTTSIDNILPKNNEENEIINTTEDSFMKEELKNFLKKHNNNILSSNTITDNYSLY